MESTATQLDLPAAAAMALTAGSSRQHANGKQTRSTTVFFCVELQALLMPNDAPYIVVRAIEDSLYVKRDSAISLFLPQRASPSLHVAFAHTDLLESAYLSWT